MSYTIPLGPPLTLKFQAYEMGLTAVCSGIAADNSVHHAIASILEEKLRPINEQLAALTAMVQNQKREAHNRRASAANGLLLLPFKTIAGHPARAPNAQEFLDLQRPVPIGTLPPSLPYFPKKGLAAPEINKLTEAQIADFEWYYNEEFSGGLQRYCCSDVMFVAEKVLRHRK